MRGKYFVIFLLLSVFAFSTELTADWTGTWSTSIYSDTQLNYDLDNATVRQVVRVSIPGNRVRLTFSNLHGASSLQMQKVHLAQSAGAHSIYPATDLTVTFGGSESVTIPAGGSITSDALDYTLPALTNMAITIYFGDTPATISGHVGSRTTSYWQSGDAVAAASLTPATSDTHWFVIAAIDVERESTARAVSCYGDSITDGLGSTPDSQNRWSDNLATRLQGLAETSDVGVLNAGIGATGVTSSGISRLQRDVINQTDVAYMIVLYGVNDIGGSATASQVIAAYQTIISQAHDNGILVYGATITPFGGSGYYSVSNEADRQTVNNWIRTTSRAAGGFDAVIDFDAALRDPVDQTKLQSAYSMDWLHLNAAGYEAMANAINLHLFSLDQTPPAVPTDFAVTTHNYKMISLDWNDNIEEDFSNYNIWRSETPQGPYSIIATATDSFYSDSNLPPSTTYYYTISSVDWTGNQSIKSAELEATTDALPNDTTAPTPDPATWTLAPEPVSSTSVTMTATTGSDLYGPVMYYFEETTNNPGGADSGWQFDNSYTNTGLSPATVYTYRVRMRDDLGNIGNYSVSESAITFDGPGEYQESGGIVSMEAENGLVGSRWITGTISGASNDQYIEINASYNNLTSNPECTSPDCIASYNFNISTGSNYKFWFRSYSNSADDDSFFWRIDNGSWNMENNRTGVGTWLSTDNSQVDGLSAGGHTLEIGYRENGTRLDKFVIQLDRLANPDANGPAESTQNQGSTDLPPATPANLTASYSDNQVNLSWSAVATATGYNVKRSNTGSSYTEIASNIPTNSFSDSTVAANNTYYYVVSAENAYGESSDSSQVIVETTIIVISDSLKIDFGTPASSVQSDYQPYTASHEAANTFTTQSYSAFGTTVSVTPTWATGAVAAAMQMYDRSPNTDGNYKATTTMTELTLDWIGTDTRSAGDPLTLTISGLPAGEYNWISHHHDPGSGAATGIFDVTVNDAGGSTTTKNIQWTNNAILDFESIRTFETTIVSNGTDAVTLVFDLQAYSNQYNAAWFVMNGFELSSGSAASSVIPVLLMPGNGSVNVSQLPTLKWKSPTTYTPSQYDVYLGTNPSVTANPVYTVYTEEYTPETPLAFQTTYFWAVVAYDGTTAHSSENTWSFTTKDPFKASDLVRGNMMLINDNAGWCWYQDDKIIYDPIGGNVLTSTTADSYGFGSRDGETDVTTFNLATGKRTRALARDSYGDDHNMGALWVRPDGRYLHLYADHYEDSHVTRYRTSTNPYDGGSWENELTYDWDTIAGPTRPTDSLSLSYTNLHYVASEGRLYNIARVNERTPCLSYSDDWGETWNFMGRLNGITGQTTYSNFYHKFRVHGDKIHFIGCEQHPRNYTNSIYHGYIQNGISYDSYGNQIDVINDLDSPTISAFTTVWATGPVAAGQYHTAWTNELEIDEDGYPVCLFQTRFGTDSYGGHPGAADHRFFYGRFDGVKWTYTELAKMGTGLHTPEQDYTGMGCIHPDNVNIIYISTPFDPRDNTQYEHHEIFRGITFDKGLTWNWTQITIDSTEDNIRPAIPQWDADNTAVFWSRGVYPGQEQYDFVLVGMIEENRKDIASVTYIDANQSNTVIADGSVFNSTGPGAGSGLSDSQWHKFTGYGNNGSCYTAGDGGTENAPAIKTSVNELADGIYDVFAYFWSDPEQNWGIRGGFSTTDMLCYSKQSSQFAEPSQFTDSVLVAVEPYLLYRIYIGRRQVTDGSTIDVYFDNYDSSFSGGVPLRTTYDGIGVAQIINISGCQQKINSGFRLAADLNGDCNVTLTDFSLIAGKWLSSNPIAETESYSPDIVPDNIIDMADLMVLAAQWLQCNDPDMTDCNK